MSLKHAILGILTINPASGYDISKFMEVGISFVWNANHSQIYPELKKLKQAGLVNSRVEIQTSKPNKEIYEITEAGREELKRWLRLASENMVLKDSFLLRAFFLNHLETHEAKKVIQEQIDRLRPFVVDLEDTEDFMKTFTEMNIPKIASAAFFQLQVLKFGLSLSRLYLSWMEDTVKGMDALAARFKE